MLSNKKSRAHSFFSLSLVALLVYFCVGWFSYYLPFHQDSHALEYYYGPSFFIFFLIYLGPLVKNLQPPFFKIEFNRKFWTNTVGYLSITFLFVLSRFLKWDEMHIWLDEYTQYIFSVDIHVINLIHHAFMQQQPPLDYVLTRFSSQMWGHNEWALKFHPLFFSFLFSLSLPTFFSLFIKSRLASFTMSLVWTVFPPLIYYSMEARPLALTLYLSLLCTAFLILYIREGSSFHLLSLLFSQFLLTTATGLQPEVYIFCLFLWGTFILYKKKEYKRIKSLFFVNILTFFYFLPTGYFLIKLTKETHQFADNKYNNFIKVFEPDNIKQIFNIFSTGPYISFLGLLAFLILFLSLFYPKEINKNKIVDFLSPFLFASGLYLLYIALYFGFISWNFQFRYVYVFYTALALAFSYGYGRLESTISKRVKLLLLTIAVFLTSISFYKVNTMPFHYRQGLLQRIQWRNVYAFLNKRLKEGDYLLQVSFDNIGEMKTFINVGSRLYGSFELQKKMLNIDYAIPGYKDVAFFDKTKNPKKEGAGELFFLFQERFNHEDFSLKKISLENFNLEYSDEDVVIYSLPFQKSHFEALTRFFHAVTETYPHKEFASSAYETLIFLEYIYGSPKKAKEYLKEFKRIKISNTPLKDGIFVDKKGLLKWKIFYLERLFKKSRQWNLKKMEINQHNLPWEHLPHDL